MLRLELSPATAADALACFVSSQFLLLAGPSGTGKSSLARALAGFFTDRSATVDAEPGLMRPADLVGYASALSGTSEFVATPATDALRSLDGTGPNPPVLIVEEANLSPIEGYLAPLTHGLSGLQADVVPWPLHSSAAPLPVRGNAAAPAVPSGLALAPFPRLLATLNVDASAPAPANKVSARAAVLLLEPPKLDAVVALAGPAPSTVTPSSAPPGHGVAGDPTDAWLTRVADHTDQPLREALKLVATEALGERRRISPRMAQRALMYQAAYEAICDGVGGPLEDKRTRHAAENALLHLLLPVLSPAEFTTAARNLTAAADADGLLADRLETLNVDQDDWRQAPDDFWSGLS